jgi:hypothetical protein
LTM